MARNKEFRNFAALKKAKAQGKDYRIEVRQGSHTGSALVMTPHGGGIETHVSLITEAIADDDLDTYRFEGIMPTGNKKLHITSENFDEDTAVELLKTKSTVVAIHGRADEGDTDTVYLGGRDTDLVAAIAQRLQDVEFKTMDHGHEFPGLTVTNIVNRGATGKGAQLELPLSLRQALADDPVLLGKFCTAVRGAIQALDAERLVPAEEAVAAPANPHSTLK